MPAQDPSFTPLKLPTHDATVEDYSQCFVATGEPEVRDGGATGGADAVVARRIAIVDGDSADGHVQLPANDTLFTTRFVAATSAQVTVNLPPDCTLAASSFTTVTVAPDTTALFIKVTATEYLVLKGS